MTYPLLVLLRRVRFYFYFIFRLRTSLIVNFGPQETCSNKPNKKLPYWVLLCETFLILLGEVIFVEFLVYFLVPIKTL